MLIRFRNTFYFVKRVPKRYEGLVLGTNGRPVQQVRRCLHTDSLSLARTMAPSIEAQVLAEWEALWEAAQSSSPTTVDTAQKLAKSHGFEFADRKDILRGEKARVWKRLDAVARMPSENINTQVLLGVAPTTLPGIDGMLEDFLELTKAQHAAKSEAQKRKHRGKYERSVRSFTVFCQDQGHGDIRRLPVNLISRAMALEFRGWWQDKIIQEGMRYDTANRDFLHLAQIVSEWSRLKGYDVENPFLNLRIKGKDTSKRATFTREWVKGTLLANGALDKLNFEARSVLMIMANTGARPSEITDSPASDIILDAEIPHLKIAPNGRELKIAHTERDLPLVGCALEVARALKDQGGFLRYKHKANSWSATANKFLREHDMLPSENHTCYSLRHYVEDALLAAGVDERVRADILGHKVNRPRYGEGGGLKMRLDALNKIAI